MHRFFVFWVFSFQGAVPNFVFVILCLFPLKKTPELLSFGFHKTNHPRPSPGPWCTHAVTGPALAKPGHVKAVWLTSRCPLPFQCPWPCVLEFSELPQNRSHLPTGGAQLPFPSPNLAVCKLSPWVKSGPPPVLLEKNF